jgi:hypothetical protein
MFGCLPSFCMQYCLSKSAWALGMAHCPTQHHVGGQSNNVAPSAIHASFLLPYIPYTYAHGTACRVSCFRSWGGLLLRRRLMASIHSAVFGVCQMQNSNWGAMVNRTAVCTFRNGSGIKLVAGLIVCCTFSKSLSRVGCEMGRKSTWADSLASYTLWWSVAIAHCAHLANSYLSWKESLLLAFVFYVFDNRAPMSMCSPWVVSLLAELGGVHFLWERLSRFPIRMPLRSIWYLLLALLACEMFFIPLVISFPIPSVHHTSAHIAPQSVIL